MIDAHCHLDLYSNPTEVIGGCTQRGMKVISVTTVPSAYIGTARLAKHDPNIHTALGLHPELVASHFRELELFEQLLPLTAFVGEIGIDGTLPNRKSRDRQHGVFHDIISMCDSAGGRVLSIHSRGAVESVLNTLSTFPGSGVAILHWFSGTRRQLELAREMGCWFSIGPGAVNSRATLSLLPLFPANRTLPESDGPFTRIGNVSANPWDSWQVVSSLATAWGRDTKEVGEQVRLAFAKLCSFSPSTYPTRPS
jgi:TatD DNase family protein